MSPCTHPNYIDDKTDLCVQFIISLISYKRPLFIGLNGIQGSGKSFLATRVAQVTSENYGLETLVISIDDFYLSHADQCALAREHQDNKLLQHRGQPGTHDTSLLNDVFSTLQEGSQCRIPSYDKSSHHGRGNRVAENLWRLVNQPGEKKLDVVILEGWCVGFSHLEEAEVEQKRNQEKSKTLLDHNMEHLLYINQKLKKYEALNSYFDGFINLEAFNLEWVYDWREEQEEKLRQEKGQECAMSPQKVVDFVDNYYPAYELYMDKLRKGFDSGDNIRKIKILTLVIGRNRQVLQVLRKCELKRC